MGIGGDGNHLPEIGITVGVICWVHNPRSHGAEGAVILSVGISSRVVGIEDLPAICAIKIVVDNQLLARTGGVMVGVGVRGGGGAGTRSGGGDAIIQAGVIHKHAGMPFTPSL